MGGVVLAVIFSQAIFNPIPLILSGASSQEIPIKEDVPWYVSLIISFLPLLLFCGAVWWHGRQIRKCLTAADGRSVAQVFADIAEQMKRANDR